MTALAVCAGWTVISILARSFLSGMLTVYAHGYARGTLNAPFRTMAVSG